MCVYSNDGRVNKWAVRGVSFSFCPALTYSSGLAAIHNVTHLLNPGDHVLSFNDIYGGTSSGH